MTATEDRRAHGGEETGRRVTVDAYDHPMVVAALARLAGSGGWARILTGVRLEAPLDLADAELLVDAGVLRPRGTGFAVLRKESYLSDPEALGRRMITTLQHALQYARGGVAGWTGEDLELVLNQGKGSAAAADLIADGFLHELPTAARALESGHGRFLDVGTGVAAISGRLCHLFPGLTCVGLDVLPHVLDLARSELEAAGVADRVELRLQSVAELEEVAVYDLAWVPQLFIPPAAFEPGLARVLQALKPGGGLVVPTLAPPDTADPMEQAVMAHAGHVLGGGPVERADAMALLEEIGFAEVSHHDYGGQTVLTAVRPECT